jgi:hypothetical protein
MPNQEADKPNQEAEKPSQKAEKPNEEADNPSQEADKYEQDEQTGKFYKLVLENETASRWAAFGGSYLLAAAFILLFGLLVVWNGGSAWGWFGLGSLAAKADASPLFRVFAFALIGGGLGGILNEIRSFIKWHAELNAFGPRFIWKTVMAPWQGAILGLVVVALMKAGLVVLGANFNPDKAGAQQAVAMFAVGVIGGYGSLNVLKWLDLRVTQLFATPAAALMTPNLTGLTSQDAKDALAQLGLHVGKITPPGATGTIINQLPTPGAPIRRNTTIDFVIGELPPAANTGK